MGPAPVWRATPRARAETLRAAPETVSGTGQRGGGERGAGCGDGRQGAGAAAGGRALSPEARGGQPLTPSLRKIAPRRAAQPLRHQEGGGVGAGPHEIERRRRKLAQNGKNDLEFFSVFLAFLAGFSGAPRLQKRPARPEPRGSAFYIGGAKRTIGGLGAEGSGPSVTGVGGPLNPSG